MSLPESLLRLLEEARARGASALHLVPGAAPRIRLARELRPLEAETTDPESPSVTVGPLSRQEVESMVEAIVPAGEIKTALARGQAEFSLTTPDHQPHHATVYRSAGQWQIVVLLTQSAAGPIHAGT